MEGLGSKVPSLSKHLARGHSVTSRCLQGSSRPPWHGSCLTPLFTPLPLCILLLYLSSLIPFLPIAVSLFNFSGAHKGRGNWLHSADEAKLFATSGIREWGRGVPPFPQLLIFPAVPPPHPI